MIAREVRRGAMPYLPPKIANAPQLKPGLELYWWAFADLSTCRSGGLEEGPIPWTACAKYAEIHGFNERQLYDLCFFVREMDSVLMDWKAKQRKRGR